MTIKQTYDALIASLKANSQKINTVRYGNSTATITTDNGTVKSIANEMATVGSRVAYKGWHNTRLNTANNAWGTITFNFNYVAPVSEFCSIVSGNIRIERSGTYAILVDNLINSIRGRPASRLEIRKGNTLLQGIDTPNPFWGNTADKWASQHLDTIFTLEVGDIISVRVRHQLGKTATASHQASSTDFSSLTLVYLGA